VKLILTLDDRNGMLFNERRLSQDSVLNHRILTQNKSHKIWMNEYTAELFEPTPSNVIIDNDFMSKMLPNDVCFIENIVITQRLAEKFEKVTIYKWNRTYPFDLELTISMKPWSLVSCEDFVGSSHEKITEENYEKN